VSSAGSGSGTETSALSTRAIAEAAKKASRVLAPMDEAKRNAVLEAMAVALEAASDELLEANALDLKLAECARLRRCPIRWARFWMRRSWILR
jgi:gamma-glutamyl phosphate reductase